MLQLLRDARLSPQKHGLVIIPDGTPNGDVNHEPPSPGITLVSQEAAQVLESAGEGPLGESELLRVRACSDGKQSLQLRPLVELTVFVFCRRQATEAGRGKR